MPDVHRYREDVAAAGMTDKEVIEMYVNKLSSLAIMCSTTSNNIRIKMEYVFDGGTGLSKGGGQTVTGCSEDATGGVFICAANGFAVGDIVTVRGQRSPDPAVDATYLQGFVVVRGTITAVATNTFKIGEFSTAGAGTFAGTGTVTYDGTKVVIDTVNLTANTPVVTVYDNKYSHIIVTRGDTGSDPNAGLLHIDASAS